MLPMETNGSVDADSFSSNSLSDAARPGRFRPPRLAPARALTAAPRDTLTDVLCCLSAVRDQEGNVKVLARKFSEGLQETERGSG